MTTCTIYQLIVENLSIQKRYLTLNPSIDTTTTTTTDITAAATIILQTQQTMITTYTLSGRTENPPTLKGEQ